MYDKKAMRQAQNLIREKAIEAIAKRLHLGDRSILKVANDTSPVNVKWEDLDVAWQTHYKFHAGFVLNDLEEIGYMATVI